MPSVYASVTGVSITGGVRRINRKPRQKKEPAPEVTVTYTRPRKPKAFGPHYTVAMYLAEQRERWSA